MDQQDQVLVTLRQIIRATDLYSRQLSKKSGLTAPQLLVIRAVNDLGEVPLSTLSADISLSQGTVSSILDRLEDRGIVRRERSRADKRVVHAVLTDAGRSALDAAPKPLQDVFSDRFEALEEWEKSMIVASLQRVATMMNAERLDASPMLHVGVPDATPQSGEGYPAD
ncbi:MAG: MarR family winged helix-turn-helix transcriptional regulator [Pseudomonadota bacterium]